MPAVIPPPTVTSPLMPVCPSPVAGTSIILLPSPAAVPPSPVPAPAPVPVPVPAPGLMF